jgi:hypothetical protein
MDLLISLTTRIFAEAGARAQPGGGDNNIGGGGHRFG